MRDSDENNGDDGTPRVGYAWKNTVYGNPRKALQYLDKCRHEILRKVPNGIEQITDDLANEWIALLWERERTFEKIVRQDTEEAFAAQIVHIRNKLAELCDDRSSFADDPFRQSLRRFQREIREFIERRHLKDTVLPSTAAVKSVDAAVQVETGPSSQMAILTRDAQSGNDASNMDVEQDSAWMPGATSTPLCNKVVAKLQESFSPVAASTPLLSPNPKPLKAGTSPKSRPAHCGTAKAPKNGTKLVFESAEKIIKDSPPDVSAILMDAPNASLQRSFSVPDRLDQPLCPGNSMSTISFASGRSSVSGYRCSVSSLSNFMPSVQPFARHFKTFQPIKPPVLQAISQECSQASMSDHNDSVD